MAVRTAPAARISRRVASLPPSGIRRFFDLLSKLDNVISLGVGEPDFTTPWHIREAAIHSLERGYTMYTSNLGLPELRRAIASHLARMYGVVYDPDEEILVTVGVSDGLDLTLRARSLVRGGRDSVVVRDSVAVRVALRNRW